MEITYSGVVEASHQVRTTANTIKDQLDALNRRVLDVVETWDGETKKAFNERHHHWQKNVDDMHQTLLVIAGKLAEATEGYKNNDLAQARRFHHQ
ncbi:WXG100 family type VII secretion target [Streptomyces olivoverticillatus]|uniref:ESAT-6-like protein n=1 Tax=Streptomyces olivoverticillatus TaxID=66427 RepID=A0A7W7PN23_9ACTN|nr:WXG100 family type VII secretion target [Streptomyces olivoverticillatus]MBB4895969.1 WXG100 family type VII secretion target [Streptomyces olivoverticillatus]